MGKGAGNCSHLLSERRTYLEKQLKAVKESLASAPDGHLRVSSSRGKSTYYYHYENVPGNGKYLKQSEHEFAVLLAQKEYEQAVCSSIEAELNAITCYFKKMQAPIAEEIYEHLAASRKALVKPLQMTEEEYAAWWLKQQYDGNPRTSDAPIVRTERGEGVRSKSEMIIADLLFRSGIPYKYECPVSLQGFGVVYPDFTILDLRTREEILWEHYGMMDDPDYQFKAYKKQAAYTRNGYIQGKNIIYTSETRKTPLDSGMVRILIEEYFLKA